MSAKAAAVTFYAIVRGPLGAGKTTIARAFAARVQGEVVSIDELVEDGWDGGSEALFLRANLPAAERARKLLEGGTPAVFDGNFYWESAVLDLESRLEWPHVVFTLRVPVDVCIERDRHRPLSFGESAVREVYERSAHNSLGVPIDGTAPLDRIVAGMIARLPVGATPRGSVTHS